MRIVAERRFGPLLAAAVVSGWREFSRAFREFPFHVGVLYSGPQQLGPANLLWSERTGYQATMVGFPYDDLNSWRGVYPEEIFIEQFDKVADGFASALEQLRGAAATRQRPVSTRHRLALESECRIAETVAIHFRSSANQARFVLARRGVASAKTSKEAMPHLARLE